MITKEQAKQALSTGQLVVPESFSDIDPSFLKKDIIGKPCKITAGPHVEPGFVGVSGYWWPLKHVSLYNPLKVVKSTLHKQPARMFPIPVQIGNETRHLKPDMVEKLRKGEIALKTDLTLLEDGKKIVGATFGYEPRQGNMNYYWLQNSDTWQGTMYEPTIPVYPVSAFFMEQPPTEPVKQKRELSEAERTSALKAALAKYPRGQRRPPMPSEIDIKIQDYCSAYCDALFSLPSPIEIEQLRQENERLREALEQTYTALATVAATRYRGDKTYLIEAMEQAAAALESKPQQ